MLNNSGEPIWVAKVKKVKKVKAASNFANKESKTVKVCNNHEEMLNDIKEIKSDVKSLLSFKSKILAGIGVISFLVSIGVNFLVK